MRWAPATANTPPTCSSSICVSLLHTLILSLSLSLSLALSLSLSTLSSNPQQEREDASLLHAISRIITLKTNGIFSRAPDVDVTSPKGTLPVCEKAMLRKLLKGVGRFNIRHGSVTIEFIPVRPLDQDSVSKNTSSKGTARWVSLVELTNTLT